MKHAKKSYVKPRVLGSANKATMAGAGCPTKSVPSCMNTCKC